MVNLVKYMKFKIYHLTIPLHDGFADDLKLLSPSLLGLQRMLNICKAFSTSNCLTFNAKKTL